MANASLQLRLLGELQVLRDGKTLALPASRKTRALLAYVVATGGSHRRERLCDLLWDGPDDPRAELRWSLSKIRPLLDTAANVRLRADRERIAFDATGVEIDLHRLRALLGGELSEIPAATLKQAIDLFHGEFLDGLDLPGCYRFHTWCLAERESLSALRLAALGALIERLGDRPEDALRYAHMLIAADPLSAAGHAVVIRLLGTLGRRRDALAHYSRASRILQAELGIRSSDALEQARLGLSSARADSAPGGGAPPMQPGNVPAARLTPHADALREDGGPVPFIGRHAERALVDQLATAVTSGRAWTVPVVTGEPGIGKSRLLAHLGERVHALGGLVLSGRAFEAEAARPYGAWIDALRAIPRNVIPAALHADLALLRPDLGPAPVDDRLDRTRLFDAIAALLRHLSEQRPTVLLLDDLQWFEDASVALLHYLLRCFAEPSALLFACGARAGELDDNPAASQLVQSLVRDQRRLEMRLNPLDADQTAELVRAVDPGLDATTIFAESEGSPLLALELARIRGQADGDDRQSSRRTLDAAIAGRLSRLSLRTRDLLVWAAALGRSFDPELLGQAAGMAPPELATALEELERRGILRVAEAADTYDFAHDLVRQAVYQTISQPRRRLVHRHVARILAADVDADAAVAGPLARHASLCGDDELAARACRIAGERCIRLFANAEAGGFADRGLWHLQRLPASRESREARIDLLRIKLLAGGPALYRSADLVSAVVQATTAAEESGPAAAAAVGHYLLSVLHQETGNIAGARDSTFRAAEAGRAASDDAVRARQLANTARCLVDLETEIPHARALCQEAATLAQSLGLELCDLHWVHGLLARWEGSLDTAVAHIRQALALARRDEDRWRELKCLATLTVTELECARYATAAMLSADLAEVAARQGEDEVPFAEALRALAELGDGMLEAETRLVAALTRLRAVDDKAGLAYALNAAAMLWLDAGQTEKVRRYAEEALAAASAVRREGEAAFARALLLRAGPTDVDGAPAEDIAELLAIVDQPDRVSARVSAAVIAASRGAGRTSPHDGARPAGRRTGTGRKDAKHAALHR